LEPEKVRQQVKAYKIMPDSVMFRVQEVKVDLTPFDLPGPTRRKVTCSQCGQVVRDHREVEREGQILCKPCAGGAYFREAREITFPDMNWSPYAGLENLAATTSHSGLDSHSKDGIREAP
jgi:formylmethanofuran dehydrogenase subunit E